jgi:uncharacterized phage protein (TIGR01671 family)
MRTIKFRFWSPQGKAFIQNYNYNGPVDELFDEREWRILVPSQYTGLVDKSGRELFEGDIVNIWSEEYPNLNNKKYVVEYRNGSFVAEVINPESTFKFFFMHQISKFEIVGSKFENPELL